MFSMLMALLIVVLLAATILVFNSLYGFVNKLLALILDGTTDKNGLPRP